MERLRRSKSLIAVCCVLMLAIAVCGVYAVCARQTFAEEETLSKNIPVPTRLNQTPIAYDGNSHRVALNIDSYIEQGIVSVTGVLEATDSGSYTVEFRIAQDGYYWGNPSDRAPKMLTWTIQKGVVDMSGVTFADMTIDYDGKEHLPVVNGLPTGVSVRYSMLPQTEVGTYVVTAIFTYSGDNAQNFAAIDSMSATLRIRPVSVTVEEGKSGAQDTLLWLIILLAVAIVAEIVGLILTARKKNAEPAPESAQQPTQDQQSDADGAQDADAVAAESSDTQENVAEAENSDAQETNAVDAQSSDVRENAAQSEEAPAYRTEGSEMQAWIPMFLIGAVATASIAVVAIEGVLVAGLGIALAVKALKRNKPQETAQAPVAEEPIVEPVKEEPIIEAVEEQPVVEEVVEEPVVEQEPIVEEPAPEPVVEEPEQEPIVEPVAEEPIVEVAADEEEEDDDDEDEEEDEDGGEDIVLRGVDEEMQYCDVVRYRYSFMARIMQGSESNKRIYSEIKNAFLSYKNVKSRISLQADTFNSGRTQLAKLKVVGKTLRLYVALDPKQYEFSKYFQKDCSQIKAYEKLPMMIKIKSERALKRATELLEEMAAQYALKFDAQQHVDYVSQLGALSLDELLAQDLVKEVITREEYSKAQLMLAKQAVKKVHKRVAAATDSNFLVDDRTADLLTERETVASVDRSNEEAISVDVLSDHFARNELVTLDAIKKKGLLDPQVTYLRVTARGAIDKPLRVVANEYTPTAAKMILIAGGKVKVLTV